MVDTHVNECTSSMRNSETAASSASMFSQAYEFWNNMIGYRVKLHLSCTDWLLPLYKSFAWLCVWSWGLSGPTTTASVTLHH